MQKKGRTLEPQHLAAEITVGKYLMTDNCKFENQC